MGPQFRLFHGDCLQVIPKLRGGNIDLILTDLPYGTTDNEWDKRIAMDALWTEYRRLLKPGGVVALHCQQPFTTVVASSNLKCLKTEWIWHKPQGTGFLNARRYPLKDHEQVLIFCDRLPPYFPQKTSGSHYRSRRKANTSTNYGAVKASTSEGHDRFPRTVLRFAWDKDKLHPTQKPIALLEYLIKTYTQPGDLVLDHCMGSGSTGVACANTSRRFIGIEKGEKYFRIARNRIRRARYAARKSQ